MIKTKELKIIKFLPAFLAENQDVIHLTNAIDETLNKMCNKFDDLELLKKIEKGTLSDEEISLLLHERHVDYFDEELSKEKKIELIKKSITAHYKKGTPATLQKMLNIIFGDVRIQEWKDYKGAPYHFRAISDTLMPDSTLIKINRTVEEYKNERSMFEGVQIVQKENINFNFGVAMHDIKFESEIKIGLENEKISTFGGFAIHEIKFENERIN